MLATHRDFGERDHKPSTVLKKRIKNKDLRGKSQKGSGDPLVTPITDLMAPRGLIRIGISVHFRRYPLYRFAGNGALRRK
jgi:hypothetical protein